MAFNYGYKTNYLRVIQRLVFTGKLRIILIIIAFGFFLIYMLKVFQSTSASYTLDLSNVEYEHHRTRLENNYAAFIDAGSSGSRIHLYTWPPHSGDKRTLLRISMIKDEFGNDLYKKITPGLSTFSDKPNESFNYIYPLLDFALKRIPSEKHSQTPLYIYATAGMRLLSIDQQEAILDNLRSNIARNCSFQFKPSNVQVITGKQEGIYSWISVNYVLGRFDHSVSTKDLVAISIGNGITTRPRTVGMMEMGGASVQIAFEVTSKYQLDEIKRRRKDQKGSSTNVEDVLARFNLGCSSHDSEHEYLLYVTTYLGLGANVAKDTYLKYLIKQEEGKKLNTVSTIKPDNEEKQVFINDPCLCLECPINVTVQGDNGHKYAVELRGTGSFDMCEQTLSKLINPRLETSKSCEMVNVSCPLSQLQATSVQFSESEFYGFSELWYSMEDVLKLGGKYNYFQFKRAASDYCRTPYMKLLENLKNKVFPNADNGRLLDECFKASWILNVLHTGFRMRKDYKNFRSVNTINNNQVQWTLGALLYSSRFLPLQVVQTPSVQSVKAESQYLYLTNYVLFFICMAAVFVSIVVYMRHLNKIVLNGGINSVQISQPYGYDQQETESFLKSIRVDSG